jgi:hypothetical protein
MTRVYGYALAHTSIIALSSALFLAPATFGAAFMTSGGGTAKPIGVFFVVWLVPSVTVARLSNFLVNRMYPPYATVPKKIKILHGLGSILLPNILFSLSAIRTEIKKRYQPGGV